MATKTKDTTEDTKEASLVGIANDAMRRAKKKPARLPDELLVNVPRAIELSSIDEKAIRKAAGERTIEVVPFQRRGDAGDEMNVGFLLTVGELRRFRDHLLDKYKLFDTDRHEELRNRISSFDF